MQASDIPRAVAAARSSAEAFGLRVGDAVVLQDSNRIAVRLAPCDVLARVAYVAHQAGAEFEVEVARRLAETDSPVAALEPRVEPRVYVRDGFVVTLWTYYEPASPRDVAPAEYAQALERLHGEPHPGNVLRTKNGLLFTDLETCCRGPVEFDIAHVPDEVSEHYSDADQDLLRECRVLMLAMIVTWRWDRDDQLPNGRRLGTGWLSQMRAALDRDGRITAQ